MKILYVASKYDYGQPLRGYSLEHHNFYECLAHMGHEIIYVDLLLEHAFFGKRRLSTKVLDIVKAEKPDLLFCSLFRDELDFDAIRHISWKTDTVTFNWFCDDHWRFENFSRRWAPAFNWVSTTAQSALPKYAAIGYNNVIKTQWACNHFVYHPVKTELEYDVTFVGQLHGDRPDVFERMRREGIKVRGWGQGWESGRVSQEDMLRVFSGSRINLNLANSPAPVRLGSRWRVWERRDVLLPQIKARVFEVPGCGGFLLTDVAENLSDYYLSGKEICTFRDVDDLSKRIRYYLDHEQERKAVAAAGYSRTLSEHTYVQRFREIFKAMGLPSEVRSDSAASKVVGSNAPMSVPEASAQSDRTRASAHPPAAGSRSVSVPAVSVLMAAYNAERYIREAIDSVLGQTFGDFELVVVDDGSTDRTPEIVRSFDDPRIRLLEEEHRGLSATHNRGLQASRGDLVARMDADDLSEPTRLQRQVEFMRAHPQCVLVGTWSYAIDESDRVIDLWHSPTDPPDLKRDLFVSNHFVHGSTMMRREAMLRAGGYRDGVAPAEDYDLYFRLSELGDLANIDEPLYRFRLHENSATARKGAAMMQLTRRVQRMAVDRARGSKDALGTGPVIPPGSHECRVTPPDRESQSAARLYWAGRYYTYGNVFQAWRFALAAVTLTPTDSRAWRFAARLTLILLGVRKARNRYRDLRARKRSARTA